MAWDRKVPYDQNGNLLHYVDWRDPSAWKEVYEFDATLTFVRFARGRSAVYAWMRDDEGHEYPLSLNDFEPFVPKLKKGQIAGKWTQKKQGENFFLTSVKGN